MMILALLSALLGLAASAAVETPLPFLHGTGLRERVFSSNDLWLVLVLEAEERCGAECARYIETLAKAERQSGGLLRGGLLRAGGSVAAGASDEEAPVHALFNLTHVPSMLLWTPGSGARSDASALVIPPSMADQLLTLGAKALYEGITPFLPSVVTAPLRSPGFPSFFSALDPECCPGRLSPVVLLHHSARATPTLKRLALDFLGRASFALVPGSDADALAAWGVDNASLPMLLVGPRGAGLPASAAASGSGKKRKASAEAAPGASYLPAPGSLRDQGWKAFPKDRNMSLAALHTWLNATLPPPAVQQLASQADFERAQGAGSGVMLIAVLGSSSSSGGGGGGGAGAAAGWGAPLPTLQRVAASSRWCVPDFDSLQSPSGFAASRPHLSWSWVDGSAQEEWAEAFGAAAPALIAFNPRKQLFAVMKGAFSEGNLLDFVGSVPGLIPVHPKAAFLGLGPAVEVRLERLERALPPLKAQAAQADLAAALSGKKKKGGAEL